MEIDITDAVFLDEKAAYFILTDGNQIAVIQPGHQDAVSCLIPANFFEDLADRGLVKSTRELAVAYLAGEPVALLENLDISVWESVGLSPLDLRSFFLNTPCEKEALLAGRAAQLFNWRQHHQFCGKCGAETKLFAGDRAMVCTRCKHRAYPRISPCVIGTVIKQDEILLVHGRQHRGNIYSAVAGFIESGETPEQAFIREVKEETNIDIENVRYVESQSWPFPGQLMLGFVADFKAGSIKPDTNEILDAGWFAANALPELPHGLTISRKLINYALDQIL